MDLILESPVGVTITVRKPNYREQAKFLSTMLTEDRSDIIVELATYIALNCTDTNYTDPEIAKKYDVDLLEVQSTTDMAVEALINRYSYGLISLWGEDLLDKLALTDKGLERKVEEEKNSSAPAGLSP